MLQFLAFPRRFTETPIAKEGLLFLRQQMPARLRWWRVIEALLIVVCLITAIVPAFLPIFTVRRMLAIYLPTVLLSWLVIARTILCGAALGSREQALGIWDDLVLTRMDAQQIILGKWWATVRYCWRSHAWMIVMRLIIAYHVSVFFMYVPAAYGRSATPGNICPLGLNAFCYGEMGFLPLANNYVYPSWAYMQPMFLLSVIAELTLVLCGAVELCLAAAFGVCASLLKSSQNGAFSALLLRSLLSATAIATMIIGNQYYNVLGLEFTQQSYYSNVMYNLAFERRIDMLETLQTAVSPLLDQGILLATNFLRPYSIASSLPYQVRQIVCVFLNVALYAVLIFITYRVAIDAAVQRHASPGVIGAEND